MQKVELRPLTYIEVEVNEPVNFKLDNKHFFKTTLQKGENLILFDSRQKAIFQQLDKLNEIEGVSIVVDNAKVECFKKFIDLLYTVSEPNRFIFRKKTRWYKYLHKLFIGNIPLMYEVLGKVLKYNSDLKKKALNLQNFDIFKNSASDTTTTGVLLSALIREDPKTGEPYFVE